MTALAIALGGISVVAGFRGIQLLRSDVLSTLPIEDLQLLRTKRARKRTTRPLAAASTRLSGAARGALGDSVLRRLQRWINEAGRPDGLTVDDLLTQIATWSLMGAAPGLVFLLQGNVLLAALAVVGAGYMPLMRLGGQRTRRRTQIDRDLPDFLDVLAVTVMAGVGFRQALSRVSQHFPGPLQEEINLTLQQINNGASIREAFSEMRYRTSSEPVAQFVSALLQSQELGAPLAEALGNIADDMRRTSAQRQRQRAARKSPQVALLSSVVLVPGVMVILVVGLYLSSGIDLGEMLGGLGG